MKCKLKKGDLVRVLAGKEKGKEGKIEKVLYQTGKVLLPTLNKAKKHVRAQGEGKPGGILEIAQPLLLSKVALMCPKCHRPTRVGFRVVDGQSLRLCKKCQQLID